MIRRALTPLFAILAPILLVFNSSGALAQTVPTQLDQYLDYYVSQDEGSWYWYGYVHGSMHNSRVIDSTRYLDSYGQSHISMMLIRGDLKYTNYMFSPDGYVLIRVNEESVSCVSYDTGVITACTGNGGGTNSFWDAAGPIFWEVGLRSLFGF